MILHSSCTIEKFFNISKLYPVEPNNFELLTTIYKISINMATIEQENLTKEEAYYTHNTNYHKILFFLENILHDSVMIDVSSQQSSQQIWLDLINPIVLVPDFVDSQFTEILHCKLKNICSGSIIDSVTLLDTSQDVKYNYVESEYRFPDIKETLGELSINDQWWWTRDDITTYDGVAKNEEDLVDAKTHGISEQATQPWKDIEKAMKETFLPEDKPKAEVIHIKDIKKRWKPKIV